MLHNHTSGSSKHHMWFHILICLAPVAGIAAIWLFQIPISSILLFTLLLLCPLSHLFMMRHGIHDHDRTVLDADVQVSAASVRRRDEEVEH